MKSELNKYPDFPKLFDYLSVFPVLLKIDGMFASHKPSRKKRAVHKLGRREG